MILYAQKLKLFFFFRENILFCQMIHMKQQVTVMIVALKSICRIVVKTNNKSESTTLHTQKSLHDHNCSVGKVSGS